MNPSPLEALAAAFVDRLGAASLLALVAVAAVWLLGRLRPSLAPATRSALWWGVSCAILVRLLPLPVLAIEIPSNWPIARLWPLVAPAAPAPAAHAPTAIATAARATGDPRVLTAAFAPAVDLLAPEIGAGRPATPASRSSSRRAGSPAAGETPAPWRLGVVLTWAFVVVLLFIRLAVIARRLRRIVLAAEPAPPAIVAETAELAARLGLAAVPPVRVSDAIDAPQVAGLWRPTLLLPAPLAAAMTADERAMTLCHELAHVRRRDLALAWAPALAERLLFFHPAARIVSREYALAREAACDAEVLQHLGAAPRDYGRLLLRLGVTRRPAALAAAQTSPSAELLRRRLAMLNRYTPPRPPRGAWILAVLLVVLALPLSLVAQRDRDEPPPLPPIPAAPPVSAIPPTPPLPPARVRAHIAAPAAVPPLPPLPPSAAVAEIAPLPPVPPSAAPAAVAMPPLPPASPAAPTAQARKVPPPPPPPPPAPGAEPTPPPPPPPPPPPKDSWVMIDEDGSTVMFGTSRDVQDARRLRGTGSGPFIYARAGTEVYVVRDRATIDRVRAEMRAQRELGERQAEIGNVQAQMGRERAQLAEHQAELMQVKAKRAAEVAATLGTVNEQIAALTGALAALRVNETDVSAEIVTARKALKDAIAALERNAKAKEGASAAAGEQAEVAERRARLRQELDEDRMKMAAEMQAMAERQAQLGREQAELGKAQRAAADAVRARVRRILEEARAKGLAETVK